MTDTKTEVLNYIKQNDGISYVKLKHFFDSLSFEWRGDFAIYSDQNENVAFRDGCLNGSALRITHTNL